MDRVQYLKIDTILLYLSQPFEINGPLAEPQRQLCFGYLLRADNSFTFTPFPISEDEQFENKLILASAAKLFEPPPVDLVTWEGFLGTAKKVAARINDWQVRMIYWDLKEDREMARRVLASAGTLDAKLTW